MKAKGVQRNGFQFPNGVNYYQICSWTYFLLDAALFYPFVLDKIADQYKMYLFGWMTVLLTGVSISCLICTSSDPTDIEIYLEHKTKQSGKEYKTKLQQYCTVCQGHVKPNTKHCGACNRCTSRFDHHCVWLNNCIGEINYRSFFVLVLTLTLFKLTQSVCTIQILNVGRIHIYMYISVVLDPMVFIILFYLLMVHIYFRALGITTYEWIRMRRNQTNEVETKLEKLEKLNNTTQQAQHSQSTQQTHIKFTNLNHTSSLQPAASKESVIDSMPFTQKLESLHKRISEKWENEIVEVDDQQSFHAQKPMQRVECYFVNNIDRKKVIEMMASPLRERPKPNSAQITGRQTSLIANLQQIAKNYHEPSVDCNEESILCMDTPDSPKIEPKISENGTSDFQNITEMKIHSPNEKHDHLVMIR